MSKRLGHIVVIGGGGTGIASMYDLCRRGFNVTLLERGELTSGTTGRHHGQLHCGARYAMGDRNIARECMHESAILRKIAPKAIEYNKGLFVAVDDEDMQYRSKFIEACLESDIPAVEIPVSEALRYEKALSNKIHAAVVVPDGTIDPWRLVISFAAGAYATGNAHICPYTEVKAIEHSGDHIASIRVIDHTSGIERNIEADHFINAAGPWAGQIAQMAGIPLQVAPSPGTMLVVKGRMSNMVVSRLHKAGDGDIIVPQRGLTIIGSTQWLSEDPDIVRIHEGDIPFLYESADAMFPDFSKQKYHTAWAAARPLYGVSNDSEDVRDLSRDFAAIDHDEYDKIDNMVSIVGGKATTLRGMGEAAADLICKKMGVEIPCTTAEVVLPSHREFYKRGYHGN